MAANEIDLKKELSLKEFNLAKTALADLNNLLIQMGKNPAIYKAIFDKLNSGKAVTKEDVRQIVAGIRFYANVLKEALKKDPKAEKINNGTSSPKQIAGTLKDLDKLSAKLEKKYL